MNTKNAEIHKMLVISTAHISEETAYNDVVGYSVPYGLFSYNPLNNGDESDTLAEKYPQDLINVFKFAVKNGCSYVLLDRDGPVYEELETFDW